MAKSNVHTGEQSLYEKLRDLHYTPFMPLANRSALTLRENQAVYKLELSKGLPTVSFCIDGVIITNGQRCDRLVLAEIDNNLNEWYAIFVELKGCAVHHAIEQLRETLKNKLFQNSTNKKVFARIIGRSYPGNKSDASFEKAKIEFKKCFKCELKSLKANQPDRLVV